MAKKSASIRRSKKLISKKYFSFNKRLIIVAFGLLLILFGISDYLKVRVLNKYDIAYQQSIMVSTRELTLKAAEGTKVIAPRDPTTGNVYFPEVKLTVSNIPTLQQLTYNYEQPTKNLFNNFSISSHSLFNKNAASLYTSANINEMFNNIPKLMSCQQGIQVSYEKLDTTGTDLVLKQTTNLINDKTLYFYIEKACPELSETVLLLANLQPY